MRTSSEITSGVSTHYAFHSLRALPCGCVAAVYRTRPWDLEVVALEARGPHCFYHEHAPGALVPENSDEPDRM